MQSGTVRNHNSTRFACFRGTIGCDIGIGGALLSTMVEVLMRVLLYGGPCRCLVNPLPCISSPACSVASLYTAKQLPQVVNIPPPLYGLLSVARKLRVL